MVLKYLRGKRHLKRGISWNCILFWKTQQLNASYFISNHMYIVTVFWYLLSWLWSLEHQQDQNTISQYSSFQHIPASLVLNEWMKFCFPFSLVIYMYIYINKCFLKQPYRYLHILVKSKKWKGADRKDCKLLSHMWYCHPNILLSKLFYILMHRNIF